MSDSSRRSRNISVPRVSQLTASAGGAVERTLLAGFAFNFAKILCDCVLVASAMAGSVGALDVVVWNRSRALAGGTFGRRRKGPPSAFNVLSREI